MRLTSKVGRAKRVSYSTRSSSGITIGSSGTFRYNSSVAYSGGTITNNGGTITGSNGFSGSVALSASGLPAGFPRRAAASGPLATIENRLREAFDPAGIFSPSRMD